METFIKFGLGNIIGLIYAFIFCFISIRKYKNASYKEKLKPIRFALHTILVMEILKISYHIHYFGFMASTLYPIIYCSLPFYLYSIILHKSPDTPLWRVAVATSILPYLVIGLYLACYYPKTNDLSLIGVICNAHSRIYHMIIMGVSIYLLHSKIYDFRFKDFFLSASYNSGYIILSGVLSLVVTGPISYFNPYDKYLSFFFEPFGFLVGNFVLCIVVYVISFLIYFTVNFVKRKKPRLS